MKTKLVVFASLLFACIPVSAQTTLWDWSWVGSFTQAKGTFTTVPSPGADGLIVGVTGTWNGNQITGMLPPGSFFESDNLLVGAVVIPTSRGLAFETADSNWEHLAFNGGQIYGDVLNPGTGTTVFDSSDWTSFVAAPRAVPWQPSDGVVLVGIILAGAKQLRRKRNRTSRTHANY